MTTPHPSVEGLTPALRDRHSVTIFDPAYELRRDDLERLLRAAQWAPSGGNTQPWAWFVLPRGSEGHRRLLETLSDGNVPWVPAASAVLVAAAQIATDPDGNGRDRPLTAAFDTGLSAASLLIEATALGLATHPFGGYNAGELALALGVPDWFQIVCAVAVGAPGDVSAATDALVEKQNRPRTRKPLAAFAFGDRFGVPYDSTLTD
ncbi:NAD(P)H-flavin oxidoreductase [Nocardioides baekrokdamisoli]|uniref:NAD(P)H-flavin oxidoreductase n=1 Tax=Nocardioides baekrokdamisoli TaxID=1804624 RepID=A0A3G9IED4_9ACTN|nr:nitroreductase family protein [Nocardioides baekrokdamisoli]BBH17340.1 NAD(P)H-flavin oxidoreductase [Nocardioides baekrokdamisoli]